MRTSTTHAFVNQFLLFTLVTLGLGGTAGLGAVWMRHQITVTANSVRALDARTAEFQRRSAETATAIEGEQDANLLLRRNTEWHIGLVPPGQAQIVHLTEDPVVHLTVKRNRGLFGDGVVSISLPDTVRR